MSHIRTVQKKENVRYVLLPKDICEGMSIVAGTYIHFHRVSDKQIMLTKIEPDLPVIQIQEQND